MCQILTFYDQAEKKRQAAMEKERQARRAKIEEEREEARQKIRDKVCSIEIFNLIPFE